MPEQRIGTVGALYRYPVKSMAAEPLQRSGVGWHGLTGDRRYAFVQPGMERSGFPWQTIREQPDLWHYVPRFVDPTSVERSDVVVNTPDGAELGVTDPGLARRLGAGVRVIKVYSGVFDTFPVSLLTVRSVDALGATVGQRLTPVRFRPNILIETGDSVPFPEDSWVGAVLRVGAMRCRIDKRDKRCVVVNTDPSDLTTNPNVLRAIAQDRGAHFGVYGSTVEPGEIAVGDPVLIES
jgi:uncharacterized protein YcbX